MMRPLTIADAPACSAIHSMCDPDEAWSPSTYEKLIESHLGCGFFSAEMVGFMIFQKADTQGDIIYIAVAPQVRGQGIGRGLVEGAMEKNAMTTLFLEVNETNEGALAFYQAIGFTQEGRRKDYYIVKNKKSDGIILKKCN